ncbi:hypothetical protein CVU82_01100 [Candidatus Falkowbacteria bacterium HGW-Falkowbacteria-1]|jgi:hypothetical protein|uniref:Uncharacterized protein n=1 Tax=Candidatus Falkowbacteria bacterium HGW-Falkowbacteria-1 TaxID=2013768 RepID=A0A2N2EAS0_9BACT|nr:MAG: hypothetical protein CVU82_01100 [Candidatus Falkowbacteria bacterium HGW-Falkowbacteria-1]
MSKLYKLVFVIIVVVLLFLNISFFLYNQKLISYLKIDVEMESPDLIMSRVDKEASNGFFDLNKVNDSKFVNLKEFSVDLTGFTVPSDLNLDEDLPPDDSNGEGVPDDLTPPELQLPSFEVGNKNPFEPFSK